MNRLVAHLTSSVRLCLQKKRKVGYFAKNKEIIAILSSLWSEKLIWGYISHQTVLKVYFKYYSNKAAIQSIKMYNIPLKLSYLKKLIQENPQSIFILKTSFGYRSHLTCLKNNLGGILVLKIN